MWEASADSWGGILATRRMPARGDWRGFESVSSPDHSRDAAVAETAPSAGFRPQLGFVPAPDRWSADSCDLRRFGTTARHFPIEIMTATVTATRAEIGVQSDIPRTYTSI